MAVRGSEGTEEHPLRRLARNQAEPRSPGAHTSPSAPHGSAAEKQVGRRRGRVQW